MKSNEEMIEYLLFQEYADEKVAKAMKKVSRELFVLNRSEAYLDMPLPIGYGQTISAPGIVAIMTRYLEVANGMKVLEIGTGSGWQAALLAELVGKNGKVYTLERIRELADFAEKNIAKLNYKNIEIINTDGSEGFKEMAPFDRIIVTAAAPQVPFPLVEQLENNGKLLVPVGSKYWQVLTLVDKVSGKVGTRSLIDVIFVPLIGKYGYTEEKS